MNSDEELKRINFVVPQELYERFVEYSKGEYKSTSGMLTGFIAGFVREKEEERERAVLSSLLSTTKNCSEILFSLSANKVMNNDARMAIEKELSELLVELSSDPQVCRTVEFQTRIIKLDRIAKES